MMSIALKRLVPAVCAALAGIPAALGDDVPFAQAPLGATAGGGAPSSLSDIMAGVQLRHIKLWEAIKAKNFALVEFEARLMTDTLGAAALLYHSIPIEHVQTAAKPLIDLQDAQTLRDPAKAQARFADLTAACNACHQAAGVGFIAIKTPASSPFSNQNFTPEQK